MLRQVPERDILLSFPNHQVHHNEGFEDDCPCRVAKAVLKRAEDFAGAVFASVRRDEDMFDILRLRWCKLLLPR